MAWVYPLYRRAFGEKIRQARIRAGETQFEIATLVDISVPSYSNVERGCHLPKLETLARLHAMLGVDANELLRCLRQRIKPLPIDPGTLRLRKAALGPDMMTGTFHDRLRCMRLRQQLTESDVALAIGRSRLTYWCYEHNQHRIPVAMFARLQLCLEFDANHMLDALFKDLESSTQA